MFNEVIIVGIAPDLDGFRDLSQKKIASRCAAKNREEQRKSQRSEKSQRAETTRMGTTQYETRSSSCGSRERSSSGRHSGRSTDRCRTSRRATPAAPRLRGLRGRPRQHKGSHGRGWPSIPIHYHSGRRCLPGCRRRGTPRPGWWRGHGFQSYCSGECRMPRPKGRLAFWQPQAPAKPGATGQPPPLPIPPPSVAGSTARFAPRAKRNKPAPRANRLRPPAGPGYCRPGRSKKPGPSSGPVETFAQVMLLNQPHPVPAGFAKLVPLAR